MKKLLNIAVLAFLALLAPQFAKAQATLSSTTLSAAVNAIPGVGGGVSTASTQNNYIQLASTTGIVPKQSMLYIDYELMDVLANPSTGLVMVRRGAEGTRATSHASGATVYFTTGTGLGPVLIPTNLSQSSFGFIKFDPAGSCTATQQLVLPQINVNTGARWNCINGTWEEDNGVWVVAPTSCNTAVSGNATGTQGYTVVGASNTPVVQAQTSNTGTNTHTYICTVDVPTGLQSPSRQAAILDVTFLYGVQTTALGTQAAVLASGTFNGSIVFSSIAYPTAAASETPSAVTPVRADSSSIIITPVAASFNTATTTAGAFYSAKFQPGGTANVGLPITTDLKQFIFTVTLQCAATVATITNSPGLLVHYAYVPDYQINGGVSH